MVDACLKTGWLRCLQIDRQTVLLGSQEFRVGFRICWWPGGGFCEEIEEFPFFPFWDQKFGLRILGSFQWEIGNERRNLSS